MRRLVITAVCCSVALLSNAQENPVGKSIKIAPEMTERWDPKPPVVAPGNSTTDGIVSPPSDAIVLFDGTGLAEWEGAPDSKVLVEGKDMSKFVSSAGKDGEWTVADGVLTVNKAAGDIQPKRTFGDFQLHIEWRIPEGIHGEGQVRGNSGVFLQGVY